MIGKKRRLARILKNGRTLIVPMDHGITVGPIKGLSNIDQMIGKVKEADAIVLHKGVAKNSKALKCYEGALIIHLSASTVLREPEYKRLVTSVESAIKLGADAVSVHINVGSEREGEQLEILGMISEICDDWAMPLLAMMYPRGKGIDEKDPKMVSHAVRIGYELGADIVKTNYTGSIESFADVVESSSIPVVVAGGSKMNDLAFLQEIKEAMIAGASGVAVGRNVFQHSNPKMMVKALKMIIHENADVEEAGGLLYEGDMVTNR
ncbi:2-amino-3,7-dideoxy-D-threo-hept-6-ulosonate synthase [Archaeoglobus sulfaticallidus PM70-1]|uniref:2-amino-3,7-dideoxy-D-threo-hept-6-ulosonate synthase n=1 Tax=Archaeoglobus sulfaticallidus PM70-1 TaxID=387631 RepID=N0BFF3_9EURY|nr:2-amino-3,7-dideoxy-D-threo-hept-6-ulosonate synthase [Archaeoglobus sulfaticallidus]AGK60982.1 2-amino-3,7-dideoxy-D-threo-hept-6-ulosonate synthase [Archaeoglobus sulfaticallidus PM70-1]